MMRGIGTIVMAKEIFHGVIDETLVTLIDVVMTTINGGHTMRVLKVEGILLGEGTTNLILEDTTTDMMESISTRDGEDMMATIGTQGANTLLMGKGMQGPRL
jgi:hypothetical protein